MTEWPEWFESKVKRGECWMWLGALTSEGYAQAKVKGRFTRVHRWAYIYANGEVDGVLHHRCSERRCVNPAHLEPMRQDEHWRLHRKQESEATHCPHGHPWDDENTYWYRGKYRQCRACRRRRINAYRGQFVQRNRGL